MTVRRNLQKAKKAAKAARDREHSARISTRNALVVASAAKDELSRLSTMVKRQAESIQQYERAVLINEAMQAVAVPAGGVTPLDEVLKRAAELVATKQDDERFSPPAVIEALVHYLKVVTTAKRRETQELAHHVLDALQDRLSSTLDSAVVDQVTALIADVRRAVLANVSQSSAVPAP